MSRIIFFGEKSLQNRALNNQLLLPGNEVGQ